MAEDWTAPRASDRPSPPFAAKELLEKARLDFVAALPDEEAQWDYIVAMSLCEEYGIDKGEAMLMRWFETGPSVKGARAKEYVEAIRAGKEVRERVTVGRGRRGGGGSQGEDV